MIIRTGCRLHFGLDGVTPPFGGCGVMVDAMPTVVEAYRTDGFGVTGPAVTDDIRRRVEGIAVRIAEARKRDRLPPVQIVVHRVTPPHHGLGSGTQLAMAVADAMGAIVDDPVERNSHEHRENIVAVALRGQRSKVGTLGYFGGGYWSHDASGQRQIAVPVQWRWLIMTPHAPPPPVFGPREEAWFERSAVAKNKDASSVRKSLQRQMKQLDDAIASADFDATSTCLYDFNRQSGRLYGDVQRGCYRNEAVAALVDRLRGMGLAGVGQSSWGPAVFALCRNEAHALTIATTMADHAEMLCPAAVTRTADG